MRIPIESSTSYRGRNSRPNWLALLLFIGIALAVGAIGAFFSPGLSTAATAWYTALVKPPWTPPIGWFGPVWTTLYVMMGTAVWIVWRERYHRSRNVALFAYTLQLMLNAMWPLLFFAAKNIGAGLFCIVALWLSAAWTLREFSAIKAAAAWLMTPYLAWLSFAVALNLNLWRHNQ